MDELKTLKQINSEKYRVSIKDLKVGENYKDVTQESLRKLKESMLEEMITGNDPQIKPVVTDARPEKDGMIIGGYHQYFAIKDWIENGMKDKEGNLHMWPNGDAVWVEPRMPKDDKHAKVIALKDNAQYDRASTERIAEWGYELIDSEYSLSNIPVTTLEDVREITLLDVIDKVAPTASGEETQEEPKERVEKFKEVDCPNCGTHFEVQL